MIYPEYISLNNWAASLVVDYPHSPIPILDNEEKWQDWAMAVISTSIFEKASVPAPFQVENGSKKESFKDWQEWAKQVYIAMIDAKEE